MTVKELQQIVNEAAEMNPDGEVKFLIKRRVEPPHLMHDIEWAGVVRNGSSIPKDFPIKAGLWLADKPWESDSDYQDEINKAASKWTRNVKLSTS